MFEINRLREGKFVRLRGLPFEDGDSDWHVNDRFKVTTGDDDLRGLISALTEERLEEASATTAYVLQRGDASAEWIGFTVRNEEIQMAFRATTAMLDDVDHFETDEIEIVDIGNMLSDLNG